MRKNASGVAGGFGVCAVDLRADREPLRTGCQRRWRDHATKEPNWTVWANDVRTMRMLDGRSHRQICEMFGRVQQDPFWVKNIMSPSNSAKKWDELVIRTGRSPVQRCVNHISEPDTEIPPGFRG